MGYVGKGKTAPQCEILPDSQPIPKRHAKTSTLIFKDYPEFKPNLTPFEVLRLGSFGGTYYRPIKSAVTSSNYDKSVNRFNVKCGGSLDMWESSGWISNTDPYGWFQWYCRFYMGRRSTDDARQIKRQLGVCGIKGRFRNQLIGKCARGGTTFDDIRISPVIRQALQHWGYDLTKVDADKYVKLKGLPKLKE